jgi:transcription elongation GreA/GreB family factor
MSRAFVKEVEDDQQVNLPDRPVSPHPNLVTSEGLAAIERTIDRFTAAYKAALNKHDNAAIAAVTRELRYWSARLATATPVDRSTDRTRVQFGTTAVVPRVAACACDLRQVSW